MSSCDDDTMTKHFSQRHQSKRMKAITHACTPEVDSFLPNAPIQVQPALVS